MTSGRTSGSVPTTIPVLLFLLVLPVAAVVGVPGAAHADPTPTEDPVEAAAGWLARELVDDERIEGAFGPDAGLTADVVLALSAAGVAAGSIDAATDWLETQVGGYTGPGLDPPGVFAGATAKLVLVAETTGRDPGGFGGTDLLQQLEDREQADGRLTDESDFGDFSSTLTQSLAVLALHRADGTDPSTAAVGFLLDQQCDDGGFRFDPDADACTSAVDTTGFAVQALYAVGEDAAADAAVEWLADVQGDDGSFLDEGIASTNSAGLAAVALTLGDRDDAADAAREWILSLQAGCDDDAPGSILADPDDAGERDRATAQAVPGLAGTSLATVTAGGAAAAVPVLSCPDPDDATDPTDVDDPAATAPDDERPFPVPARIETGGGGLQDDDGALRRGLAGAAGVLALLGLSAAVVRRRRRHPTP